MRVRCLRDARGPVPDLWLALPEDAAWEAPLGTLYAAGLRWRWLEGRLVPTDWRWCLPARSSARYR